MSEIEDSREYCHMKVATFKDWLLNVDEDFINMNMDKDSSSNDTSNPNGSHPQQQNISSDFEFEKEEKQRSTEAPTADELFLEGKLLPLQMVQKHRQNNNAAAIDNVRSQSAIEDHTIPPTSSANTMSPSHSRRFSCSDANPFEYHQFQFPADFTKRSWSQRLTKQTKQSWLVQKLKASRTFIKSWFAKSEKDKSCPGSTSASARDNNVGAAGNKSTLPNHHGKDKNVVDDVAAGDARKGSFGMLDESELRRSCAVAINIVDKGMHDHGLGDSSSSRRSSFSGVLKRQFSSSGSSFSLSAAGCNELKALKRRTTSAAHYHDPEKSVDGAIEHCKLSQQTGAGFGSGLGIGPEVAASGNQDVAPPAGKTEG